MDVGTNNGSSSSSTQSSPGSDHDRYQVEKSVFDKYLRLGAYVMAIRQYYKIKNKPMSYFNSTMLTLSEYVLSTKQLETVAEYARAELCGGELPRSCSCSCSRELLVHLDVKTIAVDDILTAFVKQRLWGWFYKGAALFGVAACVGATSFGQGLLTGIVLVQFSDILMS